MKALAIDAQDINVQHVELHHDQLQKHTICSKSLFQCNQLILATYCVGSINERTADVMNSAPMVMIMTTTSLTFQNLA